MSFLREKIVKPLTRSKGWSKVRKEHLRDNSTCAACNTDKHLEVHHIKDFSNHPELELNPINLITLCRDCHLLFGHLKYWKSINPSVMPDSAWIKEKIENRR